MKLAPYAVLIVVITTASVSVRGGQVTAVPGPGRDACVALAARPVSNGSIATSYASNAPGAAVEHCIVTGRLQPRTGRDGRPYETRFELRLPTNWNGRFLYQGGGGNDGSVAPAVGRNTGAFPETGLARGFAVVSTDAGHQGGTPEFGLDDQARVDHAYAAHERTATAAKNLVREYYGRPASKNYFVGCSGGGRQALMFAQRYPEYFDGIVACAPAMSVSSGATIAAAWDTIVYSRVAPPDAAGVPILSRAFSAADLDAVAKGILAACDDRDGAHDGMVQDVRGCTFDPQTLRCPGAKADGCLTTAQVDALTSAFAGPHDSQGRRLYVGQPWDPGISAPGWRSWKLGTSETSTPNAANTTLMAGALAYEFFTPADPAFQIRNFNFDRDPARMEAFSAVYDTYRDATLAAFRQHGGKLLMFHGTADGIFSAKESIDFYGRLMTANGGAAAAATWARLFLIPGMNHCAGGPATDSYDGLGAIVDWVERGIVPAAIPAAAGPSSRFFPGRTRPLCPYPAFAKYKGSGSLEDAANFTCSAS